MYTLQNIHTASSYEALKRNGFSDLDVVAYYGTDKADRPTMFKQLKNKGNPTPNILKGDGYKMYHTQPQLTGTQKCTGKADLDDVRQMALEHMDKTWTYRGRDFNLSELGWSFSFNQKKRANGVCWHARKTIYLSQWVLENSERGMKGWINTMVHEIAHAVNHILGGRGHDNQWRDIFMSWDGTGERCSKDVTFGDLLTKPVSKYTLVCPNGHQSVSHQIQRGSSSCGKCNKLRGLKGFRAEFKLTQIKNY